MSSYRQQCGWRQNNNNDNAPRKMCANANYVTVI